MLHYFLEGQQYPERQAIYQKITRDIYTLADDAANQLLTRNCPSFFYEQTRNMNRRIAVTLDTYAETFEKQTDTFSFIGLLEEGEEKGDRLKQIQMSYENTVREMFYTVYTSSSTIGMNGLVDSMKRFMENQLVPVQAKGMFLTALTLNILHRFDAGKINLLLDTCRHPEPELFSRAIIGLIPIFQSYQSLWPFTRMH